MISKWFMKSIMEEQRMQQDEFEQTNKENALVRVAAQVICVLCVAFYLPICIMQITLRGNDAGCVMLWAAGFGLALFVLHQFLGLIHLKCKFIMKIAIASLAMIALYVIQAAYIGLFVGENGWDIKGITEAAEAIVTKEGSLWYLNFYPNNALLTLFYAAFWEAPGLLGLNGIRHFMSHINIVFVDGAFIIGCLTVKKMLGGKGLRLFIVISIGLFVFSPWLSVPYSDTFSMPFVVLMFYLFLVWREMSKMWQRWLIVLAIGIAAGVGFMIKPTAIIMLIAISAIWFLRGLGNWKRFFERIGCILLCVGMVVTVSKVTYQVTYHFTDNRISALYIEDNAFPMTHFMMMGLNSHGSHYGGYTNGDVVNTIAIGGKAAKQAYHYEVINQRLKDMGLSGYLDFLLHKAQYIFDDGTFFFNREGNFLVDGPFDTSQAGKHMQSFFYGSEGRTMKDFNIVANGLWLVILLLCCISFFDKSKANLDSVTILRLCILGLAAFHLLFEARSRYLVNHLPVFALLATQGALLMIAIMQKANNRGCKESAFTVK